MLGALKARIEHGAIADEDIAEHYALLGMSADVVKLFGPRLVQ